MARILIVDDSEAQRFRLRQLMEGQGHDVFEAASGEAAVRACVKELPEIILMDVIMPGMNGFQATRRLSRDERTRRIPIIMVTSRALDTDRIWGMRQGATDYITKPVNDEILLAAVDTALRAA